MKRLFACILLIFSLSFLCGFSTESSSFQKDDYIMLTLDFSANGQIVQSIDFSFDSEKINELSTSIKETLDFKNALIKNIQTIRNEFLFSFALFYMQNPVEEYKINKGVLLSGVSFDETSDSVGFKIVFTSAGAWNYYHQTKSEENAQPNKTQNKNIFLNKIESQGVFPFSAEFKNKENRIVTVGERYKNLYLDSALNCSFDEKLKNIYQPTFIYDFNKRLRSNCDYTFSDSRGHKHFVWLEENINSTSNNPVKLYYYSIQKGVWLVFAITIPLTAMFIAIIIIKIKEKANKKTSGLIKRKKP